MKAAHDACAKRMDELTKEYDEQVGMPELCPAEHARRYRASKYVTCWQHHAPNWVSAH